jgi:hypothetical protein
MLRLLRIRHPLISTSKTSNRIRISPSSNPMTNSTMTNNTTTNSTMISNNMISSTMTSNISNSTTISSTMTKISTTTSNSTTINPMIRTMKRSGRSIMLGNRQRGNKPTSTRIITRGITTNRIIMRTKEGVDSKILITIETQWLQLIRVKKIYKLRSISLSIKTIQRTLLPFRPRFNLKQSPNQFPMFQLRRRNLQLSLL